MALILGSPSSVVYLNERRPAQTCSRLEDQSPSHSCFQFLVPGSGDNAPKTCNEHYDLYGFGTGGLERGAAQPGTIRAEVSDYVHKHIQDDSRLRSTLAK